MYNVYIIWIWIYIVHNVTMYNVHNVNRVYCTFIDIACTLDRFVRFNF